MSSPPRVISGEAEIKEPSNGAPPRRDAECCAISSGITKTINAEFLTCWSASPAQGPASRR